MSKEIKIKSKGFRNVKVKIGSKDEVFWTEMRDRTNKELENLDRMTMFNKAILELCEAKIKESSI